MIDNQESFFEIWIDNLFDYPFISFINKYLFLGRRDDLENSIEYIDVYIIKELT